MGNKFELNTQLVKESLGLAQTTSCTTNIGSAIPSGKSRFLTYIRVERVAKVDTVKTTSLPTIEVAVASYETAIVSQAYASVATTANAKLLLKVPGITSVTSPGGEVMRQEIRADINHPILSVAGNNYMHLGISSAATANVFCEYFDE